MSKPWLGLVASAASCSEGRVILRTERTAIFWQVGEQFQSPQDVAQGGSWHFSFFMVLEYPEMLTAGRERQFLKTFAYRDSAHIKDAISEQDIDEYLKHYASPGGMTAGFCYYRSLLVDAKANQRWLGQKLTVPVLAVDEVWDKV